MAIISIPTSPAQTTPTPFPTPAITPSATATPRLGPPQAIYSPYPEYDADWNKKGLQGKCFVRLTIDPTTGITTGVKIEKSSGSKELDGAALAACSNWRFKPWSYPQLTIPFEFRPAKTTITSSSPARYTAKPGTSKTAPAPNHNLYYLIIPIAILAFVLGALMRRRR
jgi:TonB family protein